MAVVSPQAANREVPPINNAPPMERGFAVRVPLVLCKEVLSMGIFNIKPISLFTIFYYRSYNKKFQIIFISKLFYNALFCKICLVFTQIIHPD
ncbi:hypothetical protein A2526_00575 [candidate division WOR-1 bacterium RIFOXYD2_FULL_36_8]|uniref:Uncharacterized protein n=1 Tax=candidate division WOR-1 bacterium RIFOXYB2_FULL_36_35 TaxID=1802578 RepID=A0A1F4S0J8_UNCSA|nr:MAG: hypothetical protein A2230_09095 [candidate division WOR-1 bacterium RIFOXYA2_FULL_36_21]OGC13962.1 MAG: hypothetical protein A2290_04110 [candidate division WOR-1 bacterium RIFOXYB2_FULL_36_35]OGC18734.1 MAG: hypothetical protein A2282_07515 [candidate division WOR-1 bacterium RIFOXYA12_FULL_36_13]OGC37572.1 MAG: hypothetical protein A2526_00575 [candidate division WOR-1 bacterium RIFOXYD2_FULL_36_8]